MKRDLEIERDVASRHTSTLTKRLAHRSEAAAPASPKPDGGRAPKPDGAAAPGGAPAPDGAPAPAPDIPENEGVAPVQKPKRPAKSRPRNRRHGRRR